MKAIVYRTYGSPDVLKLEEVEKPTPEDHEVLVEVRAASLNGSDLDPLRGVFMVRPGGLLKPRYKILGADIAGRVEAVGRNVTRYRPGDEVWGDLFDSGFGAFAEYVAVPEDALAPKPGNLSFEEAAAVPQAGVVALQSLRTKRPLQSGQKVLINGAGGGVGTFAVQLGKHFGAEVTGVDGPGKLGMLRSIGADHVIDYTKEEYTRSGRRYDLIVDAVARHSVSAYRRALSPGGAFVLVGGSLSAALQIGVLGSLVSMLGSRKLGILMWRPNRREDLDDLKEFLEAGAIAPVIDRRYPLSEVADAFRHLESGDHRGKLVITM